MRIKWACVTLFGALGTFGWAADYELVIPDAGTALKNSPALIVYTEALKQGDRVVSVRFGGAGTSGKEARLEGRDKGEGPLLAEGPEVGQFVGKIYLGQGQPTRKTYAAIVLEVPPGQAEKVAAAARERDKGQGGIQPWLIYAGIGIALAFGLLFWKSHSASRSTGGMVAVGPSRRSSVGELISEMQSKLDSVVQGQREQRDDSVGAKEFRKRFESLDARLGRLESSVQSTTQTAAKCSLVVASLEKRIGELGDAERALEEKTSGISSKFESLHAALAAQSKSETEAVRSISEAIDRVRTTAQSAVDQSVALAQRIENIAELVRSQESKPSVAPGDLAALADTLAELTARSQTALANLDVRFEEMRTALSLLADRADPSASLDSRLGEISAKFAEVEARLTQLPTETSDFSPLVGQLESLSTRFNEVEAKLTQLPTETSDLSPLVDQLESLSTRFNEVEAKLDAQSETGNRLQSILARIDDIETRITSQVLQAASEQQTPQFIEDLSKRIVELSEQVHSLNGLTDLQSLGGSVTELEETVSKLQAKVETISSSDTDAELASQLQNLTEQVRALEANRTQLPPLAKPTREPVEPTTKEELEPASAPPARLVVEPSEHRPRGLGDEIESEEIDEPELVAPKSWSAVKGTPEGRCSAEFQRGLKLRSETKPNLLHPVDSPLGMAPIGAPVAYARRLLFTHGASIRAFWPGREDRTIALPEPVPTDEWRILAHGSTVYCVGLSSVHVGDLNSWARKTSFDGTYFAQTHTDEHWVGAVDVNGQAFLDFRTDRGQQVWPQVALELPAEKLEILASAAKVFAYANTGEVVRVEGGEAFGAGRFSGNVVRVCRHKDMSLALVKQNKEFKIEFLTDLGKNAGTLDLSFEPSPEAFVAMDSRLYLFDKRSKEFVAIDLKKLTEVGRWSSSGVSRVRKLAGIQSGRAHYLAVVAACGEKNTGSAFVVDVKTGDEYKLCEVLEPFVVIVPADVHIAVATRCSYQNIVRVYAPFDLALSDKSSPKPVSEEVRASL